LGAGAERDASWTFLVYESEVLALRRHEMVSPQPTLDSSHSALYPYESIEILDPNPYVIVKEALARIAVLLRDVTEISYHIWSGTIRTFYTPHR
jgi:hypothetical protein